MPLYSASIRSRQKRDGTFSHDVRFRQDGQSKSLSFSDYDKAVKWERILKQVGPAEAIKLLGMATQADAPTVDEYAETFIAAKSGIEPKTAEHYRMFMRLHISPAFGSLPIDAVGPELIAKWVNAQAKAGAASKSIQNRHGFLSTLMMSAVEDDLISKNPCTRTRISRTEVAERVFLSPDDFTTLLGFIPPHYQTFVLLLATTGLRWGEATALKPSDVDVERQTLTVSRAWKSSKEQGWYLGPPKTKRSKRTVSLPGSLVDQLVPFMGREFLFTNQVGNPIRHTNFYPEVWEPARRLANGLPPFAVTRGKGTTYRPRTGGVWAQEPSAAPIGKMPRIHDLRHSHASWLISRGVPLPTIQRRLGHESITTTVDTYGHLSPDMMQVPADVIGSVLAGAMPQLEV